MAVSARATRCSSLSLPLPLRRASTEGLFLVGQPLKISFPRDSGKVTTLKRCVIVSARLSGLEEAMRIKRARELQSSTKSKKKPPLRRGRVTGRLPVPDHIIKPSYVGSELVPELSTEHQIHDDEGIACMRTACELAARVLDFAGTLVRCTR